VGIALGSPNSHDDLTTTHTCTYNGVAMTSLGRIESNNNTVHTGWVELFGLVNPPTGASTVVATVSDGSLGSGQLTMASGSVSFNGVDQTTPFGTAVMTQGSKSGALSPPRASVTTSALGNIVVDALCFGSNINNNLGTLQWQNNFAQTSGAGCGASSTYAGSAGTVTAGYTPTASDWWGLVAVDVKQVSGGPTQVNGTGAATLGAIAASGTGQVTVNGTGTAPLDVFSASGTGVAVVLGAGTAPLGQLNAIGGTFSVNGSGSAALGSINATGAGKATSFGTGAATFALNATGAGSGATQILGTGLASFDLIAAGQGQVTVMGTGQAQLGGMSNALDQVLVFSPRQRKQVSMITGSLRFSYMVSFTVWKDQAGVWHAQEVPQNDALLAASRLLAVSGRPQIVDDQTANELIAAAVGTVVPVARVNASQWM
jgi:hypothetical protein